ncbi:MAG TPA: CBS domain-containing protein [Acidobacteriota bacterium]|nr:CBS domain-containing protein [Acidobacteriota bacterium]
MGNQQILGDSGTDESRSFTRAIINDLLALDQMIKNSLFETGIRRIGAEQEIAIVNSELRPVSLGQEILSKLNDPRITTELARFNLEMNLTPQILKNSCFKHMSSELRLLIEQVRKVAESLNADIVLTGILPTLRRSDLTLENMTDRPRYYELNRALVQLRGAEFQIHIKGIDEILVVHESMMLEACNTSFQIHYQVEPSNFAAIYNLTQAVSAPLLACAANSPLLFNKRLWSETRIALFQHSIDERNVVLQQRFRPPRVTFGDNWIRGSVLELYQDNVARYRNLLTTNIDENSLEVLARGEVPELKALSLHNGTVWRWNRPCYGIIDGKPHLRIENRILPSGPTVLDEMANAAFFAGMLAGMEQELPPISMIMNFDHAKENFFAAGRHGLNAQFNWIAGKSIPANELILKELLPLSHLGLKICGIADAERNELLGVIENRVKTSNTGARWILNSYGNLKKDVLPDACSRTLTREMIKNEKMNRPVHDWELPTDDLQIASENFLTVGQFMSTDLFTVRPDDLVDLAICIMEWEHVRHVPVEDEHGHLVGLISQRDLLHHYSHLRQAGKVPVCAIMKPSPFSITPDTPTLEAMDFMRHQRIGCLPVVENERLVGIITTYDLLGLSYKLLEETLRKKTVQNHRPPEFRRPLKEDEVHHANL